MAGDAGVEPAAFGSGDQRSIRSELQAHIVRNGVILLGLLCCVNAGKTPLFLVVCAPFCACCAPCLPLWRVRGTSRAADAGLGLA